MVEEPGEFRWPPTRHHIAGGGVDPAQWNLDFRRSARLLSARLADAQTWPLTRTTW